MANYNIDSITYGSDTYTFTVPYGTCSTASATPAKTVTCANFTKLETGARVAVKFTYANTASSPTLNVNSTGAKNIKGKCPGNTVTGAVVDFVYDGINWCTSGYGVVYDLAVALGNGNLVVDSAIWAETAETAEAATKLSTARTISLAGMVTGSATFNGSSNCTITTAPGPYFNALMTQASCLANGAQVANTSNSTPPFLVSETSTSASVNLQAARFLGSHAGIEFDTEWYSHTTSAITESNWGSYYIENNSPYTITIYFRLEAGYVDSSGDLFENGRSDRIIKTLAPGGVASGDVHVYAPWSQGGRLVNSSSPIIDVEALGYDPS